MKLTLPLLFVVLLVSVSFAQEDQVNPKLISSENIRQLAAFSTFNIGGVVTALEISPDGKLLAVSGIEVPLTVRDIETQEIVFSVDTFTSALSWSPDSRYLALFSRYEESETFLLIYDLQGQNELIRVPVESGEQIAWSPNGAFLASHVGNNLIVWEVTSVPDLDLTEYWILDMKATPRGLSWSYDSRFLSGYIAEFYDSYMQILDIPNKHVDRNIDGMWGANAWAIASLQLALIDSSQLTLFDYQNNRQTLAENTFPGFPKDLAWSPDDSLVAVSIAAHASDYTVRIIGAANANELASLTGHTRDVYEVDWSKDGEKLVSGDMDGNVIIWGIP